MAAPQDNISMALYCDFENVALGVRDAKYDKFNIRPVLERLLLKGSIVVKKAYCDWDRYKEFKPQMHEASFELIEIPHVRMSGKNSADIRLVVDALDLCYTKSHVNTFVIISGDSDFSPLVSKLRENNKYVIGVGVKDSTSDLLVANCDEFIFIDDLVRESRRNAVNRETRQSPAATRRPQQVEEEPKSKESLEVRKNRAVDLASETFEALMAERGDNGKIWASALKQAIKRRKPDFNEVYFGFRTFGNLLEEAQGRGLLEIGRDDKSGSYVYRSSRALAAEAALAAQAQAAAAVSETAAVIAPVEAPERVRGRRNGRAEAVPAIAAASAHATAEDHDAEAPSDDNDNTPAHLMDDAAELTLAPAGDPIDTADTQDAPRESGRGRRSGRKTATLRKEAANLATQAADEPVPVPAPVEVVAEETDAAPAAPATGRELDLPISNAQRRAMRSSARKPARAKPAPVAPAPAAPVETIAVVQPPAFADDADSPAVPQKRTGSRSGRTRKPKVAAAGE